VIAALEGIAPVVGPGVYLAPGCHVIGRVTIGRGSSIWFNTVLRGDMDTITIGEEANIQDLSMVHVDHRTPTVIGNRVVVGHRAVIHGSIIEDECIIGMGSIIQNHARVGTHSIVASGSVVREGFEVPAGMLVAGVPAVVKRALTPDEVEMIKRLAANYAERCRLYLREVPTPG
jgi:carbonic anhydrase/acetyltransferase-like protein (isoleucine patch superfamily)